jgi:hypothetical protein
MMGGVSVMFVAPFVWPVAIPFGSVAAYFGLRRMSMHVQKRIVQRL